jgi:hypothetical protein
MPSVSQSAQMSPTRILLLAYAVGLPYCTILIKQAEARWSYLDTELADRSAFGMNLGVSTLASVEQWQRAAELNVTAWKYTIFVETMQVRSYNSLPPIC